MISLWHHDKSEPAFTKNKPICKLLFLKKFSLSSPPCESPKVMIVYADPGGANCRGLGDDCPFRSVGGGGKSHIWGGNNWEYLQNPPKYFHVSFVGCA